MSEKRELNDTVKIVAINAYIQRGTGEVLYNGEKVLGVTLGRSCFTMEQEDIPLTSEELDTMFLQAIGILKP